MTRPTTPTGDAQHLAELDARLHALETWRAHQSDLLDELLNGTPDDPDADDPAVIPRPVPDLDSDDLITWVHRHVTGIIARPLRGELTWCPLWWEHPEAVLRFEALRGAWTELAPEPGAAMSIWIRDHLDPCLRELLTPLGPFADCAHNERFRHLNPHAPLPTLPTAEPDDTR